MTWLTRSNVLARSVATHVQALQRQAVQLAGPRSLRRARAGVLRVITVVAGH